MDASEFATAEPPLIRWTEAGVECFARWQSESGIAAPKRVAIADDRMSADTAYSLATQGTALLWRGDFQNARQLLAALGRRDERSGKAAASALDAFNLHRQAQAQRARTLGMLLLNLDEDYGIDLRRSPDVVQACTEAYGPGASPCVVSLRELLGTIGAHEWRRNGIDIAAAGGRIHPHYGVFAPLRSEYVQLVNAEPLPAATLAFDIGTGTGVLAAVLVRRGMQRVIATDQDARALACARENFERLGCAAAVQVVQADLFPEGRAPLIVCNPPWLPARPSSPLDHAVYDADGRMLRGFLDGLAAHLEPDGEGWLLLSDFAELLGLRPRAELLAGIHAAGLEVASRTDARPDHPRSADRSDPLHAIRAAEVTSLWRLVARRA